MNTLSAWTITQETLIIFNHNNFKVERTTLGKNLKLFPRNANTHFRLAIPQFSINPLQFE